MVNAPPFAVENEACKMVAEAGGGDCTESADNGVSDSDSDDLGPETAVDADLDMDDDADMNPDPAPPTPPAHAGVYTFVLLLLLFLSSYTTGSVSFVMEYISFLFIFL